MDVQNSSRKGKPFFIPHNLWDNQKFIVRKAEKRDEKAANEGFNFNKKPKVKNMHEKNRKALKKHIGLRLKELNRS